MTDNRALSFTRRTTVTALSVACAFVLLHASADRQQSGAQSSAAPAAPARFGTWGVDLTAMDKTVKPGDDFDAFVNGGWSARTEIPPDQPSIGVRNDIARRTQAQIRAIIEQAPPASQLGAMYRSFMDEATLETIDDRPLQRDLKRIATIASRDDFTTSMGTMNGSFGSPFFGLGVAPDPSNSTTNTVIVHQSPTRIDGVGAGLASGLGLPDRDYYLNPSFKPQVDAYRAYLERAFTMIGYPEPATNADAVLAFETGVARASWPAADRRDIDKINNPMSIAELQAYAPGLNWQAYLTASGIATCDRAIVMEKSAIKDIAALYAQTPLDTLKAWQAFHIVDQASPYLSKRFVDSRFTFAKTLTGVSVSRTRWQRGVQLIDGTLGELLGHAYVDTYFPPSSKAKMIDLAANVKTAMAARIRGNEWMSAETKTAALEKLARTEVMVGYPDTWRDYSALEVDPADLYGNVQRSRRFAWQDELSGLAKPVDRKKWAFTPQTVNAGYDPQGNTIEFPAGTLQPPLFDPTADPAVNYGAIGTIIGHEFTHGFDDQGRKFDGAGAVRDWWTKADGDRFDTEAKRLGAQYEAYEPVPGTRINAPLTMGENIADLGGVLVALDAYHASLHGVQPKMLDGFTGDQRFFMAYGQSCRNKSREGAARQQLTLSPHARPRFRIIGPLRNVDAWYAAFGIVEGKYFLKPEDRVRIW